MVSYSHVYKWSRTFTWHGVGEAVAARKGLRIFWVSVLVVASALMVWQLYNVIHNYIVFPKYETSVTTESQGSVEFPNITICNYNRANLTRKKELNISDATLSYLYLGLPQNYKISSVDMNTTDTLQAAYELWKLGYNGSLAFDDIFLDLGHDCEPTFLLCIFGGPSFDCCSNVKPVMNQYGKCLSVIPGEDVANAPIRAVQYDPGPQGAMSLVIDPQLDEYSNVIVNDLVSQGVMLLVTNEPEAYQIDDLISLEPGTVALVSLSASKSFVTDPEYRVWPLPCKQNATLQYMPGEYTHNKCSLDCYIKTVVDYCKCGFATKPELGLPHCAADQLSCINDLWYGTSNWTLPAQAYFEQCSMTGCDVPCEPRYTFTTRVSKTIMSTSQTQQMQQVYTQLLSNPKANINDLIQVDIYYPQIELTVKETAERTSVFDLMSSIGGQIGLWGGMSVISLIQLAHFLLLICHGATTNRQLSDGQIGNDRAIQTETSMLVAEPKKKVFTIDY